MSKKVRLGVSIGDINGIGMEVIIKTFMDKRMHDLCTPVIFGSSKVASFHRKAMGIEDFSLNVVENPSKAKNKKVNLINCWDEEVEITIGENTSEAGKFAFKSLEAATNSILKGEVDVLVTAPINKQNIQSDDFQFPGHTEYLAAKDKGNVLMLMLSESIRIGVVTGHLPLDKVSANISQDKVLEKLRLLNKSLKKDFGIRKPKIAVLGLNPHAGDQGVLGKEEDDIIIPAIHKANKENILSFGPYPADSFFGSDKLGAFDSILAMYHDQGLIPFKTLAFGKGVNFTSGLSFVRTSPDHGTAFEIAGKNKANEHSFREAVFTACDIYKKRQEFNDINENPLPISQKKQYKFSEQQRPE
tara:strand:+ start:1993 stop:3066 length:1074 start_codon:yes stop_codon:yes gene_type:complete